MGIALDYTRRIDPGSLKAAGVTGVCRYLSWMYYWGGTTHTYPNPKIIQKQEYDELHAAGIEVTLNWEYDARDWLGGAAAGASHGAEAVHQAKDRLGAPSGSVIVGSADFDMSRAQWDGPGHAYAVAFAQAVKAGGYRPGVYGPWDVLTWVRDAGIMDAFWQAGMSTAWSGGRNRNAWPGAHLRQRRHLTVAGQDTDENDILIPNWGAAPALIERTSDDMQILAYRIVDGNEEWYICNMIKSRPSSRDETAAIRALGLTGLFTLPDGRNTLDNPIEGWSEALGALDTTGDRLTSIGNALSSLLDTVGELQAGQVSTEALAAALSNPDVVGVIVKAVNDDAARRAAE